MADLDAELGQRLARLAQSVPVAPWLGHVEPSPVAAGQRVRMAWLTPLLAIAVVGVVVLGPGLLWNAGLLWPNDGPVAPTDGPATTGPDASPVVGTESHGPYSIELRSERAVYRESDVIEVTGTFSYSGQTVNDVQGFKAGFGVLEPVYGISMQPAYTMECNHTTFEPGDRIEGPFRKSGGVSGSDPQRDVKLEYLRDPEFHLPPGTWHLQYGAFWNEDECGSETTRISTTIEIVVLPDDGAEVVPQAGMERSASHAAALSALPSGRWPSTSRRRRGSRRAPMRTSAGGRSIPASRSSCWGASSGSAPGRGSSTWGRAPAS